MKLLNMNSTNNTGDDIMVQHVGTFRDINRMFQNNDNNHRSNTPDNTIDEKYLQSLCSKIMTSYSKNIMNLSLFGRIVDRPLSRYGNDSGVVFAIQFESDCDPKKQLYIIDNIIRRIFREKAIKLDRNKDFVTPGKLEKNSSLKKAVETSWGAEQHVQGQDTSFKKN